MPRHNYMLGVPRPGHWREILNSDATIYGGSGQGNLGGVDAVPIPLHGRKWSLTLTLPPLGAVFLMSEPPQSEAVVAPAAEEEASAPPAPNEQRVAQRRQAPRKDPSRRGRGAR